MTRRDPEGRAPARERDPGGAGGGGAGGPGPDREDASGAEPGLRAREARRLALFAPVFLAFGVWIHFAAPQEPGPGGVLAAAALCVLGGLGAIAGRRVALIRVTALALIAVSAGFALAGIRTQGVAAPVLPVTADGGRFAVEGVVTAVDRSASGRARLTLEKLRIAGLAAERTPARIRVVLSGPPDAAARALLWRRVGVAARLSRPFGPIEPGGFDPRFAAWFDGIGAVGVVRGAVEDRGAPATTGRIDGARRLLASARMAMAEKARAALSGETGALAAALLVGDRSALEDSLVEALRAANLSHLLAISGLHMGLVCLTVFGALRLVFAFSEGVGGRFEPKKAAALGAILAGIVYLALSGGAIATWRAFAMAAVAFGAVLADRPPVTLRAVALAALLILAATPESLFDIGFQLSFAATTAMVAAFEWTRPIWRARRGAREGAQSQGGAWLLRTIGLWALALLVSSLVAGLATAPFAAAAFNRAAPYGLLANILAMPLMGFWIMPLGVAALALAPVGAEALALAPMGLGLDLVAGVARWVAGLPGAERLAPTPGALTLPLLALGGLWVLLWRTPWLRLLGVAPVAAAALLWIGASPRPELLIGPGGRLLGVMGPEGRALDRAQGESFAAQRWLRADADPASEAQAAAAGRGGWRGARGGHEAMVDGWRVRVVFWRQLRPTDAARLCDRPTLVIAPRAAGGAGVVPVSGLAATLRGKGEASVSDAAQEAAGMGWAEVWRSRIMLGGGWRRLPDGPGGERPPARPPARAAADRTPPCLVFDQAALGESGALAIARTPDGLWIASAASLSGRRLWTHADPDRDGTREAANRP